MSPLRPRRRIPDVVPNDHDDPAAHWSPCVVVAEDDVEFNALLTKVLRRAGWCVHPVGTGAAALSIMTRTPLDVLVMDVSMPAGTGLDVLADMRRDPFLGRVPVILMSGLGSPRQVRTGLDSGAVAYLTKPFKMAALLGLVQTVLSGAGPRVETEDSERSRRSATDPVLPAAE